MVPLFAIASIHLFDDLDLIPDQYQKTILRKLNKHYKPNSFTIQFNEELTKNSDSTLYIPYYDIRNDNGEWLNYFVFKTTNACQFGGCIGETKIQNLIEPVMYDKIHYFVLLDSSFHIQNIQVIEHESEWGVEISARHWLKQFFGKRPGKFELNQNIDGISGATVSVEAIINDLNLMIPRD